MIELNTILNEDCLIGMSRIADKSIDMILCDLPYGTTACKWDVVIPFEPLWEQYERVIKDNGAIVLTASQPFTSALVMSNPKLFKYEWIWQKTLHSNFVLTKYQPRKLHENVLIFGKGTVNYFPVLEKADPETIDRRKTINNPISNKEGVYATISRIRKADDGTRQPSSVRVFKNPNNRSLHPTQKPVALFEYLIKTYTNEGETVLDNCMGSGTTAIACINTGRNYIGFEKEERYFNTIQDRIKKHTPQMKLAI